MTLPELNRALTLEGPVTAPDGAGGYAKSWTVLGTLWAEVLPGTGRDTAGEDVTQSMVPYRITVRAAPFGTPSRPLPKQRLRDGVRVFRILAVTERDGDARYLTCFAREEEPV
jgi:head-tail adaptor